RGATFGARGRASAASTTRPPSRRWCRGSKRNIATHARRWPRDTAMLSQAIAAYAHYLSIFCTLAPLVAELALFRQHMDARIVRLLPRLDLFYLVAVVAIIVTGLLRVYFFA